MCCQYFIFLNYPILTDTFNSWSYPVVTLFNRYKKEIFKDIISYISITYGNGKNSEHLGKNKKKKEMDFVHPYDF